VKAAAAPSIELGMKSEPGDHDLFKVRELATASSLEFF
jgi:hypothetical protein